MPSAKKVQDKTKEIEFFDAHALTKEYNVFSDSSNEKLIDSCLKLAEMSGPGKAADLGCGSGVFTAVLASRGFKVTGVDLSPAMIQLAKRTHPASKFKVGDVEKLPFADNSLDLVLMSGLLHHLPDPTACIREVYRVLKPQGAFMAFDPNRFNPFMYLYRDRSAPFYSSKGVTENERPVIASQLRARFEDQGFRSVRVDYLSNLEYRYVASALMRHFLPIYNKLDAILFSPRFMRRFRAFVLSAGRK